MSKSVGIAALVATVMLAGCAGKHENSSGLKPNKALTQASPATVASSWSMVTEQAAQRNGVEQKLVEAIITVESGAIRR